MEQHPKSQRPGNRLAGVPINTWGVISIQSFDL